MIISKKTSTRTVSNGRTVNAEAKQNEATIYLYGDIGFWGIDYLAFVKEFNELKAGVIHLRIDSGGGDIFAARAIKTAIMQHKAKVIAHIDGLAASAASFLAMGADEVEIVDGGFIMIHNAASFLDIFGYFDIDDLTELSGDLTKEIGRHKQINESIANDYAKRTGKDMEQILAWMAEETWFTASDAVENGLADRIYDGEPIDGSYDLSVFNNAPDALKARNKKTTKRVVERALRDAGICANLAKVILRGGLKDDGDLREAAPEQEQAPASVVENQREVDSTTQREVASRRQTGRNRVDDLLIRAEMAAPSR